MHAPAEVSTAYDRFARAAIVEAGPQMTAAWGTPAITATTDVPLGTGYNRTDSNTERDTLIALMRGASPAPTAGRKPARPSAGPPPKASSGPATSSGPVTQGCAARSSTSRCHSPRHSRSNRRATDGQGDRSPQDQHACSWWRPNGRAAAAHRRLAGAPAALRARWGWPVQGIFGMSASPVFTLELPSRRRVQIDLSVATMHSDFAFTATDPVTGRVTRFDAHHSGERFLFLHVLHRIAYDRPVEVVLADVARIRDDLAERTSGLTATSQSENNFEDTLPPWTATLATEPTIASFAASFDRAHVLLLTPTDGGLTISWQRGNTPRPRDPKIDVPTNELWRFAAGMMWRSYDDGRDYPMLTRINTSAYNSALDAFAAAMGARAGTA